MTRSRNIGRGGSRHGAGRPQKPNKSNYRQVTTVLRTDTIAALRQGARSKFFGEFLQWWLDIHPLPTYEQYQSILKARPMIPIGKRRTPVLVSVGGDESKLIAKKKNGKRAPQRLRSLEAELAEIDV
jgi:hypothetical protein